ncbi:MAG: FkbM family methyltransferase [Lentimonas sp.]
MYFCPSLQEQLKNTIKYLLQSALGFHRYLYFFARFKIATLRWDKKEKDFFQFMELMENKEGVIVDVGANIGVMSVHLGRRFPNNRIVAIEPMPDNIKVLKKVKKKFDLINIKILSLAAGNEKGTVKMVLPQDGKTKMQGLSHVLDEKITEWNKGEQFEVELKKLDKIFKSKVVSGIKMDVENYEYEALLGAEKLLKKDKPVIYLELWDNTNRQNCFDFLSKMGYTAMIAEKGGLKKFNPAVDKKQNFIFLAN